MRLGRMALLLLLLVAGLAGLLMSVCGGGILVVSLLQGGAVVVQLLFLPLLSLAVGWVILFSAAGAIRNLLKKPPDS